MGAWLAIIGLGVFHGLNPGMGWLLAVSNGMQARRASGVLACLPPLALGHLLAIAAVVLPVAVLEQSLVHHPAVRLAAGGLLLAFGAYKLIRPRHPRTLARIGPGRITLWSFLMASAHGAGLMLVPFFLDLTPAHAGHHAHHLTELERSIAVAGLATAAHTLAMIAAAGLLAWLVYRYLGLRLLSRAWFNVDLAWAIALIAAGVVALWP